MPRALDQIPLRATFFYWRPLSTTKIRSCPFLVKGFFTLSNIFLTKARIADKYV